MLKLRKMPYNIAILNLCLPPQCKDQTVFAPWLKTIESHFNKIFEVVVKDNLDLDNLYHYFD